MLVRCSNPLSGFCFYLKDFSSWFKLHKRIYFSIQNLCCRVEALYRIVEPSIFKFFYCFGVPKLMQDFSVSLQAIYVKSNSARANNPFLKINSGHPPYWESISIVAISQRNRILLYAWKISNILHLLQGPFLNCIHYLFSPIKPCRNPHALLFRNLPNSLRNLFETHNQSST